MDWFEYLGIVVAVCGGLAWLFAFMFSGKDPMP